jgi:hypothetical protein
MLLWILLLINSLEAIDWLHRMNMGSTYVTHICSTLQSGILMCVVHTFFLRILVICSLKIDFPTGVFT